MLRELEPDVLCEIGAFRGTFTKALLRSTEERGARLHVIDPAPNEAFDPEALHAAHGARFVFHRARSLEVLPEIRDADAVVIDGDHNWYTVYNELTTIALVAAEERRPFPLTFMHDVDWPYADRDMYYDPEAIPPEYRQPYDRGGILPDRSDLVDGDGLNADQYNALAAGGPRNGVRTAIDDFLSEVEAPVSFASVNGFFGLGILHDERQLSPRPQLRRLIEDVDSRESLIERCREIERGRVQLLMELQAARRLAGESQAAAQT